MVRPYTLLDQAALGKVLEPEIAMFFKELFQLLGGRLAQFEQDVRIWTGRPDPDRASAVTRFSWNKRLIAPNCRGYLYFG